MFKLLSNNGTSIFAGSFLFSIAIAMYLLTTDISLLSIVLLLPLIGVFILLFIPSQNHLCIKKIALNSCVTTFFISLLLLIQFDNSASGFQFTEKLSFFKHTDYTYNENASYTVNFIIGLDGISLFFIILTCFLIPVCILVSWTNVYNYTKEYCICFLMLETLINTVFSVLDLRLFYIFFEIQKSYRAIFQMKMNVSQATNYIEKEMLPTAERDEILEFIKNSPSGIVKGYGTDKNK